MGACGAGEPRELTPPEGSELLVLVPDCGGPRGGWGEGGGCRKLRKLRKLWKFPKFPKFQISIQVRSLGQGLAQRGDFFFKTEEFDS